MRNSRLALPALVIAMVGLGVDGAAAAKADGELQTICVPNCPQGQDAGNAVCRGVNGGANYYMVSCGESSSCAAPQANQVICADESMP